MNRLGGLDTPQRIDIPHMRGYEPLISLKNLNRTKYTAIFSVDKKVKLLFYEITFKEA